MKEEECCERKTIRSDETKEKITRRLNLLAGQVKGIGEMINNDRYCDEILDQLSAVHAGISAVIRLVLENHIKTCITRRIKSDDNQALEELMKTLAKII